ncbi:MAG: PilW family protein, partial [Cocleimonas sp.]
MFSTVFTAPARSKPSLKQQSGLSLIELLIASAIGLFLIGGIYQTFLSTRQATVLLQAEAEMQENARFAFSVLSANIKKAGDFGCKSSASQVMTSLLKTNNTTSTTTLNPQIRVQGWEAKGSYTGNTYKTKPNSSISATTTKHWLDSTGLAKDKGIKSKKQSDILKVWYTKPYRMNLSSANKETLTFPSIDLEKGNILAVNDCQSISFVQVCACEEEDCEGNNNQAEVNTCNNINKTNALTGLNLDVAEVGVIDQAIFFVSKRASNKKGYKNNIPSLYVRHLGKDAKPTPKQEILEGVESLQIVYGEDTDNDDSANYYVSADAIN